MACEQHEIPYPPPETEAGLRVSDRERERVVELLSEHAAEGRLTLEELDARTEAAHTARTRSELAALIADLPASDGSGTTAGRMTRTHSSRPSRQLVAFVAVNLVLVAVWALSGGGYFWPIWPMLGWGIGVLADAGGSLGRPCRRRSSSRASSTAKLPSSPAAGRG